jgi:hypothetical protein
LAALGVVSHCPTEDHESAHHLQKGILLLVVILRWVGLLLLVPLQEPLHEGAILVLVLDGVGVVWARSLELLPEVIQGTLGGCLLTLAFGSSHE